MCFSLRSQAAAMTTKMRQASKDESTMSIRIWGVNGPWIVPRRRDGRCLPLV